MSEQAPTARTRVRRLPELGVYERERVDGDRRRGPVLPPGLDRRRRRPTGDPAPIHARIGDTLYVHGSSASSMLRTVKTGLPVAIAITIVDGIRFARSMFEHSMNYRTVVVYGTAEEVTDADELDRVFDAITDHVAPGRARRGAPPEPRRAPPDDLHQGRRSTRRARR